MERAKEFNKLISAIWQAFKPSIINPPRTDEEWEEFAALMNGTAKGFMDSELPEAEKMFVKEMCITIGAYLHYRGKENV